MKTFIKWQGNKSKHINKFIDYIPDFTGTYIEPFLGSGALFLKLEPEKWIINDLNKDLINVWNSVKNHPDEIITIFKEFGKTFKKKTNTNKIKQCKDITSNIENMKYDIERASNYILMKYCSFYGDIFVNNKFQFLGINKNIYLYNYYSFLKEDYYNKLLDISDYLNDTNGKIYNKDYKVIFNKSKKGDFMFIDPPYKEEHNYTVNYNKDEKIDTKFIKTLYNEVKKLDKKGVLWLMTQADTKEIKNVYKEYNIKKMKVYRTAKKDYVNELIIMNYDL